MEISSEYVSDDYLHLNSCGIECHDEVDIGRVRERGRLDYHILYIHTGVCYAEPDGIPTEVYEGGLILFRPTVKHKYAYKAVDKTVVCYLHFTGSACKSLTDEIFGSKSSVAYIGKSNGMKALFEKMTKEYILKKEYYKDMCTAYLMEFFTLAKRKEYYTNVTSLKIIDDVCLHMNSRYTENLPLKYYADFCHMSVSRFAHLFKEAVGTSPMDYIMDLKIKTAKELLLSSDFSVAGISDFLGFGSQNYFSRIFKIKVGVSPMNFVKFK